MFQIFSTVGKNKTTSALDVKIQIRNDSWDFIWLLLCWCDSCRLSAKICTPRSMLWMRSATMLKPKCPRTTRRYRKWSLTLCLCPSALSFCLADSFLLRFYCKAPESSVSLVFAARLKICPWRSLSWKVRWSDPPSRGWRSPLTPCWELCSVPRWKSRWTSRPTWRQWRRRTRRSNHTHFTTTSVRFVSSCTFWRRIFCSLIERRGDWLEEERGGHVRHGRKEEAVWCRAVGLAAEGILNDSGQSSVKLSECVEWFAMKWMHFMIQCCWHRVSYCWILKCL